MTLNFLFALIAATSEPAPLEPCPDMPALPKQREADLPECRPERWSMVGPTLDPLDGSTVYASDRDWLPQTRQLANLADFWFLEPVNMQNSGGGIATFDPQYTAAHGRSYTLTGHYWNNINITDPARPGEPLMQLPYFVWDSIRYESLNSVRPGYHVRIDPSRDDRAWARLSEGANVGGSLLIPDGVLDREPAFTTGASPTVRELDRASEAEAQLSLVGEQGSLRLVAERLDHRRRYPALVDPVSGEQIDDESTRSTFMGVGRLDSTPVPLQMLIAYQSSERTHEDGQFRLPIEYTSDAESDSLLVQLSSEAALRRDWTLSAGVGFAQKSEERVRRSDEPIVRDILEEWFWLARPRLGEDLRRELWDAHAELEHRDPVLPYTVSLRTSYGSVRSDPEDQRFSATTHLDRDEPVSIEVFDPAQVSREWIRNTRVQLDGEWRPNGEGSGWAFRYSAGVDWSAVGTPASRTLSFLTPGAGVVAEYHAQNGSRWYFLLRREPDPLTFQHARFLSPTRPSGLRYRWLDDGDFIPEAGEEGALQARFGGPFHQKSEGLDRPTSNVFSFGWESPQFGAFKAILTGIAQFHLDAMTVRYAGPAADGFSRRLVPDPGGDRRGASNSDGGADFTPVFDRLPGTNGEELYTLVNRDRENLYIGGELQLVSIERDWWFLNFQAKGYWNIGAATFGSFPDRNDPNILDENSVDPNQRVNQRGRIDQDRSFAVKVMSGIEPLRNLRLSVSLRYRDGQPFTRLLATDVDDGVDPLTVDNPQIPVAQMAVWRGGPRHTFHMHMDGRIRYDIETSIGGVALIADGFNLYGSATELLEDPRQGDSFRRSLEAIPGRAFLLSVELSLR